jgi:ABC-type glycerol-3-phosphate transport system substrate-binding protein
MLTPASTCDMTSCGPRPFAGNRHLSALGCGLLLALATGCSRPDAVKKDPSQTAPSDVSVRLLVVGDPAIASALELLKGEWHAQTGSSFAVEQAEKLDLAGDRPPEADAIILPSYDVGALVEKRWIVPLPKRLIEDRPTFQAGSQANEATLGNWPGIFSLLRAREAAWGSETVAVPLGSAVLVCYYRADLLERLGATPPKTWGDYHKLASLLADRGRLGKDAPPARSPWYGALEPLGPGWAGVDLLARAACYATHRSNYSTLFHVDTMEPLIDGPPFVRAMKELVAVARSGPPEQFRYDPAAVRRAFWQGQCALALTWPTASEKLSPPERSELRVGFVELPGSSQAYNVSSKTWDRRTAEEATSVPLLGIAGRMGVVSSGSPSDSQAVAFRLLLWLSDDPRNRQMCVTSPATTLFRQSDLNSPEAWVESPASPSAAAQYAELTRKNLTGQAWLFAVRIPGRGAYLRSLDEAVHLAVKGEKTPEEALKLAAQKWADTTRNLGLEPQRTAYQHSLGL